MAVVGTIYLDGRYVTFKYFAFLSVCDKFELLGYVHALHDDSSVVFAVLLGFIAGYCCGFIGLFWSSYYLNLSSLQISGSTRVYPFFLL